MPKRFAVHQFENGLTVVLEFMPQTVSTAVGFHVKTGARDEQQRFDGVSHFLEHMMFKGTHNRTWVDINREFDLMGARYNAFTSWEETCYYAWVLNEEAPKALDLLSDMLASKLPEDEFTTEKKVILEEIARYRDMPDHVAFEEALKIAFARHRLSSNILGTNRTVGGLTRDQMADYFNRRYVPNNIVLFACGNVDEAAFLAHVDKIWAGRKPVKVDGPSAPPEFTSGRRILRRKDVARQNVVLLWPSLPMPDRRSTAMSLLGAILGDDRNSRLYWALRHTGLAEEAGGGYWGFSDTGLMAVHASCDPDKAQTVEKILRAETAKLKHGISKDELQRVKNRARTSLVFSAETPFNRFRQLMHQWTVRRELLTPEEMLQRINEVTVDDLYALLKEFPLSGAGVMVGLGPDGAKRVGKKKAAPRKVSKPARAKTAKRRKTAASR